MNKNLNLSEDTNNKLDFINLFVLINNFKLIISLFCIVSLIISFAIFNIFSKSKNIVSVEIYKRVDNQVYNTLDNNIIYESLLLNLKDFNIHREIFTPVSYAKAVFGSASFSDRHNKFSISIPDSYISNENISDFKKLILLAAKQTLKKNIKSLKKKYRNISIEKEIIFNETNLLNLDEDYAKLRLGENEIIAVVEKDFIREILALNVEMKLIDDDIQMLSEGGINDFLLINIDNIQQKIQKPILSIYLILGLIAGLVLGVIVSIFRRDYLEYKFK